MLKKLINQALILSIAMSCLALPAQAQLSIDYINVSDIQNSSAKIRWQSSEPSRGLIYYGTEANDLNYLIQHTEQDYWHDTIITGLKKRTKYYYKVVAINAQGQRSESFLQNFDTGEMTEAVRTPDVLNIQIKQVTHDAVAISWQTDIPTRAKIKYYYDNNWPVETAVWYYQTDYSLYLYNLTPNNHYYLIIDAESETGGHKVASAAFNTSITPSQSLKIAISDLQPISFNSNLISANQAQISWKTNLVAKSNIYYGTASGQLYNKLPVNEKAGLEHQITLRNLKANTNYYYRLEIYDTLYGQYLLSDEKSLTTRALSAAEQQQLILGEKIIETHAAARLDSDGDGLSDNLENAYGTNPRSYDSDQDGFNDKLEIDNNFNPLGYGRTLAQITKILSNKKSTESKNAKQLVSWLPYQKTLPKNWSLLVNAYVFGGYPVEDIRLAAKGKTNVVNTNIPYRIWKDSDEYKQAKK